VSLRLSPHFTVEEFQRSSWALRRGMPNEMPDAERERAERLCLTILEPLRLYHGHPIVILSGYRSVPVNAAVGGASTSQHLLGEAGDFVVPGFSNIEIVKAIVALGLPFDQLIYEFGEAGWVHVSHGPRHRKQVLSAVRSGGGTVYLPLNIKA
jgi:uncharacterized protein YcbK (DUF882 family)